MKAMPVGASLAGSVPEDEGPEDIMDDHEAKMHLGTLMDAHGILNNPDKMKRVHALAGRHTGALKSIKSVKDLKNLYDEKYGNSSPNGHQSSSAPQKNDLAKTSVGHDGNGDDGN